MSLKEFIAEAAGTFLPPINECSSITSAWKRRLRETDGGNYWTFHLDLWMILNRIMHRYHPIEWNIKKFLAGTQFDGNEIKLYVSF